MIRKFIVFALLALSLSCNNNSGNINTDSGSDNSNAPTVLNYTVVNAYPHDTTSYTEGFLVHDGQLFESSGSPNDMSSTRSLFGVVDLKTGKINVKAELDKKKYFGEGIVFLNGKVYQLTWQTKVGFIYDAKTFKKIGEFTFPSAEGWGMTTDGTSLIMGDGTSNIYYLDPNNFKLLKIVGVTDNNGPLANINELEYINGFIYANVYQTNYIVKIDPVSGKVLARADLSSLQKEAKLKYPDIDYLNGIAYDSASKKIYVTGKLWPNIYEIKFNN